MNINELNQLIEEKDKTFKEFVYLKEVASTAARFAHEAEKKHTAAEKAYADAVNIDLELVGRKQRHEQR